MKKRENDKRERVILYNFRWVDQVIQGITPIGLGSILSTGRKANLYIGNQEAIYDAKKEGLGVEPHHREWANTYLTTKLFNFRFLKAKDMRI